MNFTKAQQKVIASDAPAMLVVAGPGAGKSSTVVARIKRLVASGVNPNGIAAISFTNAASNILKERLGGVRIGANSTLHGLALRWLKEYGAPLGYGERIAIVNEETTADLIASKAQSLGCKMPLEKLLKLKAAPDYRVVTKTRLTVEQMVIRGYYADLREAGLCDYDSILTEFLRLLKAMDSVDWPLAYGPSFTHLIVDETQDSGFIDWDIFDELPMRNKMFIGDTDQAVFRFRGGMPQLMEQYGARPGVEVHWLEENFRSHSEITDAAQRLILHNRERIPKETRSVKGPGGSVTVFLECMNAGEEQARVIGQIKSHIHPDSCSEIAVLARTNALANEFRDRLAAAGIPVVEPTRSTMPKDWPLTRALVSLLVQPDNDTLAYAYLQAHDVAIGTPLAQSRQVNHIALMGARSAGVSLNRYLPELGFARTDLMGVGQVLSNRSITAESRMLVAERIKSLPAGAGILELSLSLAVHDEPAEEKASGVFCGTLHAAKGREFDVVFLVGFEDEVLPGKKEAEEEENRRLAYVGVTRARKMVFISHASQRVTSWGATVSHTASRFIAEMLASK
jgi:DNA helicase-2/ATP-dependent DNA helicase PcrA